MDGEADVGGSEGEDLEAQLAELQAQEAAAAAGMRLRAERERARGLAVSHQRTIWDGLLSLRMLLQRSLQVAVPILVVSLCRLLMWSSRASSGGAEAFAMQPGAESPPQSACCFPWSNADVLSGVACSAWACFCSAAQMYLSLDDVSSLWLSLMTLVVLLS